MHKDFKIKDFLKRIKNTVEIKDGVSYKRVTVSGNHNGVSLRDKVDGSKIGTKKQFTISGGNFILSKIDARNGAFGIIPQNLDGGIITGNFWTYQVDTKLVDTEWFFYFTHSFNFIQICIESSKGSTHRKYLNEKVFLNHDIFLPSKSEQVKMVAKYKEQSKITLNLRHEIEQQKKILAKLNQSVLFDAIQGKLTENWRNKNNNIKSSKELFEEIKAKKIKLTKEKKIKKEKALLPIFKEEIPFKLPNDWLWARLGDLCSKTGSGKTPKGGNTVYISKGIKFIRSQNVYENGLILNGIAHISEAIHLNMKSTSVQAEDLLLNITGGSIGRCCIVPKDFDTGNINQHVAIIRPVITEIGYFIHNVICSPYFQSEIIRCQTGAGREGLPKGKMDNILIPLPPLAEQKFIVDKVNSIKNTITDLEKEIKNSQEKSEMLIQAVLKETFETKEINETKVIVLPTKPTNIDYYKRTLLATEIVWQLQKEPTLGHLKLQKLIYLAQESSTMQLPTNFLQQVAGPYDPKMARSLDKQMKTKKWFEYKKTELLKFKPLEKAGEHQTDFEKFFANEKESIQYIIDTFKTAKSDSIELVGTLYACWKKLIEEKQMITDEIISKRFYEWSEQKAKFEPNRIIKALRWMETKGIVPEKANA